MTICSRTTLGENRPSLEVVVIVSVSQKALPWVKSRVCWAIIRQTRPTRGQFGEVETHTQDRLPVRTHSRTHSAILKRRKSWLLRSADVWGRLTVMFTSWIFRNFIIQVKTTTAVQPINAWLFRTNLMNGNWDAMPWWLIGLTYSSDLNTFHGSNVAQYYPVECNLFQLQSSDVPKLTLTWRT